MVYSYRRQVLGLPTLAEQQHEILSFVMERSIVIDKEVVEYTTKNLPLEERKEFEAFLAEMKPGNTVIVSSLSVLSDRADELVKVINCILTHNVDLWVAQSGMLINKETSMVEIFPLLAMLREEGQERNKQIGRPKGSKSHSKFDVYHRQIVGLLSEGMSVSAIARDLEVSRSSLKDYIESRSIKDLITAMGNYTRENETQSGLDNIVLICPFEEEVNKVKVS